jgi:hypothetical protein
VLEKLGSDWNGTALSLLLPLTYIFSRLVAWYRQEGMRFGSPFDGTRFDTIRALADTMGADRAGKRLQWRKIGVRLLFPGVFSAKLLGQVSVRFTMGE